ncbi:MAG: phage tail length tape measure family protein [Solirubrobacteraceae bacterium]
MELGEVVTKLGWRADNTDADRYERRRDKLDRDSKRPIVAKAKVDADTRGADLFGRKLRDVDRDQDKLAKGSGRLKGAMGSLAGGAGIAGAGLAFGALAKGAMSSVKAFEESQVVAKQTAQVIKTTGGAARVTAAEVAALSSAISKKTGIDDEAIQSGANMVLTFTNIRNEAGKGNDVFDQTTRAVVDMSDALGTDAKSAALQLGKALNDPTAGMTKLMRSGVSFTEQQKKQVETLQKSGDILGAQKIILKEVNKEFGGTAAATKTASESFKTSFGNLQEAVGEKLAPTFQKATDAATKFMDEIVSGEGDGGQLVKDLKDIASAVSAVYRGFQSLSGKKVGFFDISGQVKTVKRLMDELLGVVTTTMDGVIGALEGFNKLPGPDIDTKGIRKARDDINKYRETLRETGKQKGPSPVVIRAQAGQALAAFREVRGQKLQAKVARILGQNTDAKSKVEAIRKLGIPLKTARVLARVGDALTGIRSVQDARDRLKDKTVTLTLKEVSEKIRKFQQSPRGRGRAEGRGPEGAEDALVGEGRVARESIVNPRTGRMSLVTGPQIRRLEPEDYVIPHDPSMRGRAVGLMQELAADMGLPGYKKGRPAKRRTTSALPNVRRRLGAKGLESGMSAQEDRITGLERSYDQKDREFNLSDEVLLIEQPDGSVIVDEGARRKRLSELADLARLRGQIMREIQAYIAAIQAAVKKYRDAIASLSRARRKAKKKDRAKYDDEAAGYQSRIDDLGGVGSGLGFDKEDSRLDLIELAGEAAEIAGTKGQAAPPVEPAAPADSGGGDSGGGSGGGDPPAPETRPPSMEEIAEEASKQFGAFTQGRADLFSAFGSNSVRSGASLFSSQTAQAAGLRYFGGANEEDGRRSSGAGGMKGASIVNNFAAPPPDAHGWTADVANQLGTI